ncbi:hypothetical protein BCR32DRAFT_290303, partial [Anaeromyces robustus]
MEKNLFFLLLFFYNISVCWSIFVCKKNLVVREENGFYYGIEDGEECIIILQNQERIEKRGYFDTCNECNVKKYHDSVFYGYNNDNTEICQVDLNHCNDYNGLPDMEIVNKGFCRFCYYHRFENQLYIGYENGHECLLDMNFCTKANVNGYCTWCKPFTEVNVKVIMSSHVVHLKSEDAFGEECNLNITKCGYFNMRNYNKTRRICTYCTVVDHNKEINMYYGREDYKKCEIEKEKCSVEIEKYENFIKNNNSGSLLNVSYLNINILSYFILL